VIPIIRRPPPLTPPILHLETISHYVTVAYERLLFIRELREADRHKDEFLATLAHELRNPLAPIQNALEVMKMAGDWESVQTKLHRF
jgi:signal transduction histidine kinase